MNASVAEFPFLFTGLLGISSSEFYIHGEIKELSAKNIPHGFVANYRDGHWENWFIDRGIVGLSEGALGPGRLMVICADGTVVSIAPQVQSADRVDSSDSGPSDLKRILAAENVFGCTYCVGMSRLAYRQVSDGSWERISTPIEISDPSELGLGFRAVTAVSREEVYCAGFAGEIWKYSRQEWTQLGSPTNVRLDCCTTQSGQVYIGGASGLVICGKENSWIIVDHGLTTSSISDIVSFQGQIYFADGDRIMTLEDDVPSVVAINLIPPPSIRYLHSCSDTLWAIGRQDILKFDGTRWDRLQLPNRA